MSEYIVICFKIHFKVFYVYIRREVFLLPLFATAEILVLFGA